MYGTVNQAIVSYLQLKVGDEGARTIRERSGVTHEFIGMEQYPDSDSVGLVVAAAEYLQVEVADVLGEVGEHWVDFALASPFGDHLRLAGSNFQEVLEGLDDMHVRLSQDFSGYEPPSFSVQVLEPGTLQLHYRSVRPGLAPLAIGIFRRLAEVYGEAVEIGLDRAPSESEAILTISGIGRGELREAS